MESFSTNYFEKLCADLEQRNAKLWEWELLPQKGEIKCICGAEMKFCKDRSAVDGNAWRCFQKVSRNKQRAKKCDHRKSFRHGTIFENSHLPIWKLLSFIHLWLTRMNLRDISNNLGISTTTSTYWGCWCHKVILNGIMEHKIKLGGPGRTVELYESKFGRRKYHRGHQVEGQWVFGGIERETGRVCMVPVEDRSRKTLLKIIKEWIQPGTTIISDCWKAYEILKDEGYIHLKVDHKLNFVDPVAGELTNSIESSWRHANRLLPEYSRKKHLYASYLAYYMFEKQCRAGKKSSTREFFKYAASYLKNFSIYEEEIDLVEYDEDDEVERYEDVCCAKKAKYEIDEEEEDDIEYEDVEYLEGYEPLS